MTTLHHFRAPEEIGHQNPLADFGPCIALIVGLSNPRDRTET